jgi:hypothetical protein
MRLHVKIVGSVRSENYTEGTFMKPLCIILSLVLLFAGCYSHLAIPKEESSTLDNEELTFHLTDGSHIDSKGGQHHKVAQGYEVTGRQVCVWPHAPDPWNPRKSQPSGRAYTGMVPDDQIDMITVNRCNTGLTILAIGLPVVIVSCVVVWGFSTPAFGFTMSGW